MIQFYTYTYICVYMALGVYICAQYICVCIDIYSFSDFFPLTGYYYKILSIVPCAIQ